MKISISELRETVRSVIKEIYMSPKNLRGIGPDIDREPGRSGKLTVDQMLRWHPDASHALIEKMKNHMSDQEFNEMGRYPREILSTWQFFKVKNGLVAKGEANNFAYNPADDDWYETEEDVESDDEF